MKTENTLLPFLYSTWLRLIPMLIHLATTYIRTPPGHYRRPGITFTIPFPPTCLYLPDIPANKHLGSYAAVKNHSQIAMLHVAILLAMHHCRQSICEKSFQEQKIPMCSNFRRPSKRESKKTLFSTGLNSPFQSCIETRANCRLFRVTCQLM